MNIPDPPWKKKSRPCPFHSQGRCVFAESCGFLHDVKVKGSVNRHFASLSLEGKPSRASTPLESVVSAPLTITLHSPTSPPSLARSPRMASLLSALQGIVAPDSQESTELSASVGREQLFDTSDASHLSPGAVKGTGGVHSENMEHVLRQGGDDSHDSQPQNTPGIINSATNDTSPTSDSDILEDGKTDLSSPPGLLSPVQIGTVPSIPFPHSGSDVAVACEDSIDSDSAEAWVGPTPFSLSPPHLSQPGSTLDYLSSPFCSPVSRVLPRRLSFSASRMHDSIDIVSPPHTSTVDSQQNMPFAEITSLTLASQAWHSHLHSFPPEQTKVEDSIPSHGTASDADLSVDVSNGSPTTGPPVPIHSSDMPVLTSPIPMSSCENHINTQFAAMTFPKENFLGDREEYSLTVLDGPVGISQVPIQLSSTRMETNQPEKSSPHSPLLDTGATPAHSASVSEHSFVSPGVTTEVREFDYQAWHQSLVMSPEGAASKHMSRASRSSMKRASSLGTPSVPSSTTVPPDELRHTKSTVDLPPCLHHLESHVAPALMSEYTSHTSSPSSGSGRAGASASAQPSHTSPLTSSNYPRLPAEKISPQSSAITGPSGEVKSLLNHRYEPEHTGCIWNSLSTSRKVPFGFRNSITSEKGPLVGGAPTRKRPSALSLIDVPSIDRSETPGSTRSFSSLSSQSKPSWARPLRLSQSAGARPTVSRSSSYRDSLASFADTFSDTLHPQHYSPSSSHSSHSSSHVQTRNNIHSENHIPNVLTHNASKSAPYNALHLNPESQDDDPRPAFQPSPHTRTPNDDASESEDQLRTFTLGSIPLPSVPPLLRKESSLFNLVPSLATTPERSLIFAIASDNAGSVRRVLEHGHADPNGSIGPQSALAFALTNERLAHKLDIVKALLSHGANPAALRNPELNPPHRDVAAAEDVMLLSPPPTTTLEAMDPATRYYVSRADAAQSRHLSTLLQKSFFRPLGRVRYDIIGQDRVFEQLFTVLNQHSRTLSVSPLVFLLCGPSGHGKSFLARRFGSLLDVPTHTVNVTTLQSPHDLWDSYSMSPDEELSARTLSEFLLDNEGKRCVVVLDEIEKVEEPRILYSLLMPWEIGRCSPKAGHRPIDVRQVIWLGTSNIGHDLVFKFCKASSRTSVNHEEYLELVQILRPKISQCLGASLSSRITAVLPFVPFTEAELMAIATEAFYFLGGERSLSVSPDVVERISRRAIESYIAEEGARSLHRVISYLLTDIPEPLQQSST